MVTEANSRVPDSNVVLVDDFIGGSLSWTDPGYAQSRLDSSPTSTSSTTAQECLQDTNLIIVLWCGTQTMNVVRSHDFHIR